MSAWSAGTTSLTVGKIILVLSVTWNNEQLLILPAWLHDLLVLSEQLTQLPFWPLLELCLHPLP